MGGRSAYGQRTRGERRGCESLPQCPSVCCVARPCAAPELVRWQDRKSTRLNSSHLGISYAVFCLKKNRTESVTAYSTNSGTCGAAIPLRSQKPVIPPFCSIFFFNDAPATGIIPFPLLAALQL